VIFHLGLFTINFNINISVGTRYGIKFPFFSKTGKVEKITLRIDVKEDSPIVVLVGGIQRF